MKHIIIAMLMLVMVVAPATAGLSATAGYSFDGNGLPEYPNEGVLWASVYGSYVDGGESSTTAYKVTEWYDTNGNTVTYYCSGRISCCRERFTASALTKLTTYPATDYVFCSVVPGEFECLSQRCLYEVTTSSDRRGAAYTNDILKWADPGSFGRANVLVTITNSEMFSISGNTSCLNSVQLNDSNGYLNMDYLDDDYFNFTYLIEDHTYTLIFDNEHEYEFTITDDMIYDYDGCTHTKYRFEETCNNLILDSEGLYIENQGVLVLNIKDFYEPSGILDISNSSADHIYIYTDTFIGKTAWLIDPVISDTEYTLINPKISWSLKVIVINDSDGALIDDAMVKVDQTCYCTTGYSTRQKMTVNGMAQFTDMSLQDASLFVMKSGYKICNENSTGYDAFLSGRTNFSSKTWVVKLAPSWSENVSTFYESYNKVDIHFRNVDGNRTSQILDTDAEVYLYYENNNTNDEAMTLKFQSSSTHSYFSDELSWAIAHDDIGHKTIANSYFTPWDYSYRAIIYNSSVYGWNITIPLTVRNATKETTLHYENLTTHIFFMGASDGKIDYRDDMNIGIHACSNNTTLMYVDIELYKNNSLLCYKNLTASDFINADFQYWYVWNPIYEYVAGANYSIRMYGFDRTLLETDYIECVADEITRKNKLTIIVKNRFGTNLDNAFVYLEGYGALHTGVNSYASYEGLDNGYYRYKATKPGYDAAGWDDVTLSNGDEIRTYILTETASAAGAANQPVKADDDDLRNLYITLMAFLLIFILYGGFLYVSQ